MNRTVPDASNGPASMLEVFGTSETPPAKRTIIAGPLSVEFLGTSLGAIRYNGLEILRGISYLVRDENWGTCPAEPDKIKVAEDGLQFWITFKAKASHSGSTLSYTAKIEATSRQLTFSVVALADRDFKTNRTGFVVLHPIKDVAGKRVVVSHSDGSRVRSKFPKLISPGQPFFDIRALEHHPATGLTAHVLLEGNTFEMEDQRNWGDASFKTYVRSLLDPWPYMLKAQERFKQSVTLTISGDAKAQARLPTLIPASRGKPNARLPEIGLALSEDDTGQTLRHLDRLRELSPVFLSCSYLEGWTTKKTLDEYAVISRETEIPIRLEIVLAAKKSAHEEMRSAASALQLSAIIPSAVTVTHVHDLKSFQPTDIRPWGPDYQEMADAAQACFPDVTIGGGMASFFTEFNRKPPQRGVFDFLTHSICPIVHDASDAAVMQTLETLAHVFASARNIIGLTPYHLGPTTIAARMNPYGKNVSPNPDNRRVCLASSDPRQFGEFAVTWNLALLAASSKARLHSVTLGALCGPRGLLDERGAVTPLFKLLASIIPACGSPVTVQETGDLIVLSQSGDRGMPMWIGNKSGEMVDAQLTGLTHQIAGYCSLRLNPSPPSGPTVS